MRLYKVTVRQWLKEPANSWKDADVLLEADNIDSAGAAGFDLLLANAFFGVNPADCATIRIATAELPYYL